MKLEIFIIYANCETNFIRSIFYYVRIENDKFVATQVVRDNFVFDVNLSNSLLIV